MFLATALGLIATPTAAAIWTNWQWLNPRPQGHSLGAVASSETLVVAVGAQGAIVVSENTVDWETVNTEWGLFCLDVTWTGNRFVAVGGYSYPGDGVILTSPDGRKWTEVFRTEYTSFNKIVSNGNQLLVIGTGGMTVTSTNGFTWIGHPVEELHNNALIDLAWNGSTYVAVGGGFWGFMAVYYSEDGISWTMASLEGLPLWGGFDCIVWGHGRFLAFAGWNVLSSPDGISWVLESRDSAVPTDEVIATPEGYLGVGSTQFWESPDGLSWVASGVFPGPRPKALFDLVRFQEKLIVVGADGAIAVSADEGVRWETLTTWEIASVTISDLCRADDVLIATVMGTVYRSVSQFNWQAVTSFGSVLYSARRINDAFWVVGSQGLIAVSDDGIAWVARNAESGVDYADIATNGEVMVAVGARDLGQFRALAATSANGNAWNAAEIDDGDGLRIASVTWTGTRFVAVGSRGSVFRSDDGYQWEFETLNLGGWSNLWRVASNGSVLVAVGARDFLISNDDGLTWRPTLIDKHATDLIWTGEFFIAVGRGQVFFSRNGEDWGVSPVGFYAGSSAVEFKDGELIVAGSGGNLVRAELLTIASPLESPQTPAPD